MRLRQLNNKNQTTDLPASIGSSTPRRLRNANGFCTNAGAIGIILLFTLSCKEDIESFPDVPSIQFEKIEFIDLKDPASGDSLKFTFSYTDGDEDFGLDSENPEHTAYPYQRCFYYSRLNGAPIPADKVERGGVSPNALISYADRSTPPYDTLPDLTTCQRQNGRFYICESSQPTSRCLYASINKKSYNISMEFYTESPDGIFRKFDFDKFCATMDGRVPTHNLIYRNEAVESLFEPVTTKPEEGSNGPFLIKKITAKRGIVTYSMVSTAWNYIFTIKRITIKAKIMDRAFNVSNQIETPPFVLKEI